MKKINIIIALGLMTMGLTACQDGDWDKEINADYEIGNKDIVEHNVMSIKDLKTTYKKWIEGVNNYETEYGKYSNYSVHLIEEDIQMKGWVVTNDEGGNLSQQIIVTDETNENMIVSIADNDIMTYLRVGDEILVDLKGLYIGGYNGTPQIGYPNEKFGATEIRMSFMSRFDWYKHFKKIGHKDGYTPVAVPLTSSLDAWTDCSRLVYVDGHFANNSGNVKIAEPSNVKPTDTSNCSNEIFSADNGVAVQVRTSTYCDFASEYIPATNVRITGVVTWSTYDGGYWQMQLRNADDIAIHCPTCNEWIGSTKWTRNEAGNYVCPKCATIVNKTK